MFGGAAGARLITNGGRLDLRREPANQVLLEPVQLLRGQPGPVLAVQYVQVDRDLPYGFDRASAALLARRRGQPGGRPVLLTAAVLILGRHQAGQPDRNAADTVVHANTVHVTLDAQEYQGAGERVRNEQRAHERVAQTALVALALGVRDSRPFYAVVVAVATETPLAVVRDHHGRQRPAVVRRVPGRRRGRRADCVAVRRGRLLRTT